MVQIRTSREATVIFSLLLGLFGAAWIPLFGRFEVTNLVALLSIPLALFYAGRVIRVPPIVALLFLVMVWLFFSLTLKGGEGANQPIRSLVYVVMSLALLQLPQPDWRRAAIVGTVIFMTLIFVSSIFAGKNLIAGILEYLTSFNRSAFVFQVIRPLLNGFASGDATYVASVMNTLASALAVLFILSLTQRAYLAAMATGSLVFILFSTSAVLAVVLTLAFAGLRWIVQSPTKIGPIFGFLVGCLAFIAVIEPALGYLALNISGDDASRAARLSQYGAALGFINASPFTGAGYVHINGHVIHNSLLFVWVSAGIVPALLVLAVYILAIAKLLRSVWWGIFGDLRWIGVAGLLCLFLIRITFGGGGGLPAASAMVALSVALILERGLLQIRDRPQPTASPLPAT